MAFDFPTTPTLGQKYPASPVAGQPNYVWDGEKWKLDTTGSVPIYVSTTAPAAAVNGALWWESDSGLLYVRYSDGTSTQWVIACPQPSTDQFLLKTGFELTGDISMSSTNPSIFMSKAAGTNVNQIIGCTGGDAYTPRWTVQLGEASAETGANAGSDFVIFPHNDAGVIQPYALYIERASGKTWVSDHLVCEETIRSTLKGAPTTGVYYFGPTNDNYLYFNGSQYSFGANGAVIVNSGAIASGTGDFICAAQGGNVVLRPNGIASGTGQMVVQTSGQVISAGSFIIATSGSFYPPASVNGGFQCKAGDSNAVMSDWFNCYYGSGNVYFYIDNTYMGTLTFSSDYRMKKDVELLPSMWDTVKALRPIKYTHQDFTPPSENARSKEAGTPFVVGDDIERWGFVAHEMQETLIESAATGVKDAPGTIQSPNPWTVIAALTKALQEAMTRIEALENGST